MGYLVIKGNNQTRSYYINTDTNYSSKPYLKVSSGYLNLTTADTTGLRLNVKKNNQEYRPIASTTFTDTNSYHTNTRQSYYTTTKTAYYGQATAPSQSGTVAASYTGYGTNSSTWCNNNTNPNSRDTCIFANVSRAQTKASTNVLAKFPSFKTNTATWSQAGSYLKNTTSSTAFYNTTIRTYSSTIYSYTSSTGPKYATNSTCNGFQTGDGWSAASVYASATVSSGRTYKSSWKHQTIYTITRVGELTGQVTRSSTYTDYYYTQTITGL